MNNIINEIKEDVTKYINKSVGNNLYTCLYKMIKYFEEVTDYGLSAEFNYNLEIKDEKLYIENIYIGGIKDICDIKINDSNDTINLKFCDYDIIITLFRTYENRIINDVYIDEIIKQYKDKQLFKNKEVEKYINCEYEKSSDWLENINKENHNNKSIRELF